MLRSEARTLVTGVNLVVLVVVLAATVFGAFDGMTDAAEERPRGNLTVGGPAIYAGWCMFEIALRRSVPLGAVLMRLLTGCLLAPALIAVPTAVVVSVAVAFPATRDAIASAAADNGGFHYYWSEGIVAQLFLMPLAGWVVGASIALGVALILTLPILSLRAPALVAAGSHIEKVDGARGHSTAAFVFCGLGATILGIVLWVFGRGGSILEFPEGFGRFIGWLSRGYVPWAEAVWLLGVIFVVIGVALWGWACVRVLFARSRAVTR